MEKLYRENAEIVYYFLLSLCKNEHLAEELTQETFLRAYQSLERYNGTCKLSVWLCQIAKHLWMQHLEKHKREVALDDSVAEHPSPHNPEREVLTHMETMDTLRALHHLPEPVREVMYLRLFCDLSFREIGDILDKSENWARVTFYRGKEKIREELREYE